MNEAHSKLIYTATISNAKISIQFGSAAEGNMETDVKSKKAQLVFDHNNNGWSSYKGDLLVQPLLKQYRTLEASLESKNIGQSASFKMNLFIGNQHDRDGDNYSTVDYGMLCTLKK